MKVIGLAVDGIRKLTAVNMEFKDKGLIQIKGKNKQGKTSVLDSFEILLSGGKYIESDMLTHGKERAEIVGTIGEYEVKRVITDKSNRLEIKNKDGFTMGSKPQAFLDAMINELTFNPRPFLDKSPEAKLKFMADLFDLNTEELDAEIAKLADERLIVGRMVKSLGTPEPVEKVEAVNIQSVLDEKNEVVRNNQRLEDDYSAAQSIEDAKGLAIETLESRLSEVQQDRLRLLDELALLDQNIVKRKEEIEKLPRPEMVNYQEPADVSKYDKVIANTADINALAQAYTTYTEQISKIQKEEGKYADLDCEIAELRQRKQDVLKNTDIPVPGLEIREDGVYHDGIHSENWSESEGIRISSELCIAMNPKLRAIFIDKGESYDSDSLKDLEAWAIENDIQAFITIVDDVVGESEDGVFYIEEGEIV